MMKRVVWQQNWIQGVFLTFILGCQGTSNSEGVHRGLLPSPSSLPSQKPTATPESEPSNTSQPQPTPVQKVEVVDITPPEFVQAGGKFLTLAVDDNPTDPTVFVEYSGGQNLATGLWKFKAGNPPTLLLHTHELRKPFDNQYLLNYLDMKYSDGALYLNTPDANTVCLKKIPLDKTLSTLSKPISCYSSESPFPLALAVSQKSDIFTFTDKHPICGAALRFLKVTDRNVQDLFSSQPIGFDKELEFYRATISYGGKAVSTCQGIHHGRLMSWPDSPRKWVDPITNIAYEIYSMKKYSSANITLPSGVSLKDLPPDTPESIPLISDGPADKATFWLPFFSYMMDVDRNQNLYLRDRVGTEEYIRKITPEGYTTTLVSTSDKDSMYHFKTGEVNILAETGEKEEQLENFVIDQKQDYLYILGTYLYRLNLKTNRLTIIGKEQDELRFIGDKGIIKYPPVIGTKSQNARIGGDGNIYLQSDSLKIEKVLIPQTKEAP